ncbi:DNA-directed RNA polymerase, subunit C11/M/9 [Kipferlia bialata]|uniref:DNA-directed RNA polymerase subunit n=1 Tax=Kipferlia bialata TaxID=797122 RepID=A0A9K3GNM0_9EUKA|nr:DNA-directed RNA polymerase, subunit C11/M/9 [Kipferlia bialata]|eukprot:g12047.t1
MCSVSRLAEPLPLWRPVSMKFCPSCCTLLDIDPIRLSCCLCGFAARRSELGADDSVTVTEAVIQENTATDVVIQSTVAEKAEVEEPCPRCNHDRMYFFTMQIRSADEGQTCFYECIKCHHKFMHNN